MSKRLQITQFPGNWPKEGSFHLSEVSKKREGTKRSHRESIQSLLSMNLLIIKYSSFQAVSFVLPSACDLELTSSEKGWLNAIIFVGMMVGGYSLGGVADIKVWLSNDLQESQFSTNIPQFVSELYFRQDVCQKECCSCYYFRLFSNFPCHPYV